MDNVELGTGDKGSCGPTHLLVLNKNLHAPFIQFLKSILERQEQKQKFYPHQQRRLKEGCRGATRGVSKMPWFIM